MQDPGQNPQTVTAIDPLTEQPTSITRPDNRTTGFGYNSLGELASQSGSGLLSATFGYDLTTTQTGNLNSLTLTGSVGAENTSWAFDGGTGLEKTKTFADGSADGSLYNLARNPAGLTLPGISAGAIGYNSAGEPISQSLTDSVTGVVSSTVNQQDDMGRPVVTTDADNGKSFSTIDAYTPLGDLRSETFGSAGNSFVKYDYFPTGNNTPSNGSPDALQTMTVSPAAGPVAATGYTYDTHTKQLNSITVNGTTFTIGYQSGSADWVSSVQAGNVTITFTPKSASGGLLQTLDVKANGASVYHADYDYNSMDQRDDDEITRTNVSDTGVPSQETDSLGYVFNATKADALAEVDDNNTGLALDTYRYDAAGNLTGTTLGSSNTLNQYSVLTYNSRGDVTGDGTYTYGWDANDRLISVTPNTPGSGSYQVKFTYDSQDRWLTKDVYSYNTGSQSWSLQYSRHAVWDGSNLVAELDQNNVLLKGYTWGPNGLLAVTDYTASGGPKTYAVVSDASGNVVELLDPVAGTVTASFHYDPWGNLTSSTGPAKNVCSFLGKGMYVHAELPWLMFAGHRVSNGRIWLSRDPSGESGGLNLYELFGNDPINNVDPSGLRFETLKALWASAKLLVNPSVQAAVAEAGAKAVGQAVAQNLLDAARDPEAAATGETVGLVNGAAKAVTSVPTLAGEVQLAKTTLFLETADELSGAPNKPESSYVPLAAIASPDAEYLQIPDQMRQQVFESAIGSLASGGLDERSLRAGAALGEFEFNVGLAATSLADPVAGLSEGLDFVSNARVAGVTVDTISDSSPQFIRLGTILSDGRVAGIGPSAAFEGDTAFSQGSMGSLYDVGLAKELRDTSIPYTQVHHVGQSAQAETLLGDFNATNKIGYEPSIRISDSEHLAINADQANYPTPASGRDLLARDIWLLRNNTDAPNSALKELIELNKTATSLRPWDFSVKGN